MGKFERLIETADALIVGLDIEGRITLFNPKCQELTGYSEDEVLGHRLWDFLLPERFIEPVKEVFRSIGEDQLPSRFENPWVTKESEERYISWSNTNIKDEEGHVVEIFGVGIDITERVRAEEEIKRRNRDLAALYEIALATSATRGVNELLKLIYEEVRQLVSCDSFSIALVNKERGELRFEITMEEGKSLGKRTRKLDPEGSLAGWVVHSKKPFLVKDWERERDALPAVTHVVGKPVKSWLGIPLLHGGEAIGVMTVQSFAPDAFGIEEERLLTTFASQAAIAIENARLYEIIQQELDERKRAEEELRRRAEELDTLQVIVLDITAPHHLPSLLQAIVERAVRLLNALGGGLYLCDPEQGEIRCVVSYNTPRDYSGTVLEYGEGAAGIVAQTGEPLIINDYRVWGKRAGVYEKEQPFTAVISAPMTWQGQVTGVIHVLDNVESRHFTQADLELLTLFANHAAIAVENARLHEQAQREIAEHKQTEEEIRRLKEFNENIIRNVNEGILIEDAAGYVTFVNPKMMEMLGRTEEELIGVHWTEIVPAEYVKMVSEELGKRSQDIASRYEAALLMKDGHELPVLIGAQPLFDDDRYVGTLSVFTDITERKQAEEVLCRSRERLERLHSIAQRLVACETEEEIYETVIKAASEILQFDNCGLGIRKGDELIRKSATSSPGVLRLYRSEGGICWRTLEEQRTLVGNPQEFTEAVNVEDYQSFISVPIGDLGVFQAIAKEKDAFTEEDVRFAELLAGHVREILRHHRMEEEAARLKSEFTSTVSHELRTPLTSIKGYADLLLAGDAGELNDTQKEFLQVVVRNSDRLAELLNDLLDIDRIESGERRLELRELKLDEILRDVAETFRVNAEEKGLSFASEIEEGIKVRGDADHLTQACANLLSNAIKYTKEGFIRLSARSEGGEAIVQVTDSGVGMNEEELSQLFKRFFRADNRYVKEAGGTGLGLSIVKATIERHGGEISVESEPNVGSTFTVTLPLLRSWIKLEEMEGAEGPTVLIIEDDADIASLIKRHIEGMGYRAAIALSGREGIERAAEIKPALITLDILMPEMDGFEVIKILRAKEETSSIPVVFISILRGEEKGLKLGASAYLTKPINEERLKGVINELIETRAKPILAVDDDPDFCRLIERLLEREGLQAESAHDGKEALRMIEAREYQLILLDKNLPQKSGIEVLLQLRADNISSAIPVIMISGSPGAEEIEEEIKVLGAKEFLSKRLEPEEIVEKILKFIDRG